MRYGLLLVMTAVLSMTAHAAETPSVKLHVSHPQSNLLELDEVRVRIEVAGSGHPDAEPEFDAPAGLTLTYRGSGSESRSVMTPRGFSTLSKVVYNYAVSATNSGKYELGPARVRIGGKEYVSNKVAFEVLDVSQDEGCFLEIRTPRETVTMMERFTIYLDVYVKKPEGESEIDPLFAGRPPVLTVRWIERDDGASADGIANVLERWRSDRDPGFNINGLGRQSIFNSYLYRFRDKRESHVRHEKDGTTVNYWKYTFGFPFVGKAPGNYTFDPVTMRGIVASVIERDNFGELRATPRKIAVVSNSLAVTVNEPPDEGRPPEYNGAIGVFRISATADADRMQVGDPVTLRVFIDGTGELATVRQPDLENNPAFTSAFKVYRDATGGEIGNGRKVFTYTIRPTKPEVTEIPSIRLAYYNPEAQKYEMTESEPIRISVTKGDRVTSAEVVSSGARTNRTELTEVGDGVYANYTALDALTPRPTGLRPWQAALIGGSFACFAGLFFFRHYKRSYLDNASAMRRRKALARARETLALALDFARRGQPRNGCDLLGQAVSSFVADKLDLATKYPTAPEAERALRAIGAPAETVATVVELLERSEGLRFSGGADIDAELEKLVTGADRLLRKLNDFKVATCGNSH